MTFFVPKAESPRSMICPLAPARAGGADGLLDLPGGAASGAGLAAAQPRLGDHRRRLRRRQRGDQRGQSLAQQRPSGDLGVPERGALVWRVRRPGAAASRCPRTPAASMPGSSAVRCASAARCSRATAASWLACPKVNSRSKIPNVEGAYTSSNTRGVPPARNTFDIVDAVRAAHHARDDRGQLPGRIDRARDHPCAGQIDMLADQPRKTGLLSQFHDRHQTSCRHQIRLVEHRRPDRERMR